MQWRPGSCTLFIFFTLFAGQSGKSKSCWTGMGTAGWTKRKVIAMLFHRAPLSFRNSRARVGGDTTEDQWVMYMWPYLEERMGSKRPRIPGESEDRNFPLLPTPFFLSLFFFCPSLFSFLAAETTQLLKEASKEREIR